MARSDERRRRPTPAGIVGGALVIAGFALSSIDWGFLALAAVGTFGPGILRELGLLKDHDEFQRRAAHRAGYHAYLVGGLVAFLLVAAIRSGGPEMGDLGEVATLLLVVLWFTWFLSSLLAYWGPKRTAMTILLIFGAVWLLFNILGNIGSPMAMFMQCLVAVPFFALALVARKWPRVAGVILLATAGAAFVFFDLYEILTEPLFDRGRPFVLILFIGPLVASAIGLFRREEEPPTDGERELRTYG